MRLPVGKPGYVSDSQKSIKVNSDLSRSLGDCTVSLAFRLRLACVRLVRKSPMEVFKAPEFASRSDSHTRKCNLN